MEDGVSGKGLDIWLRMQYMRAGVLFKKARSQQSVQRESRKELELAVFT